VNVWAPSFWFCPETHLGKERREKKHLKEKGRRKRGGRKSGKGANNLKKKESIFHPYTSTAPGEVYPSPNDQKREKK